MATALSNGQPLLRQAAEDVGVVVPAAVVERDERHAGLDQPPGEQGPLAEAVAAVGVADLVGLAVDVERLLGRVRRDQVVALAIVLVEAADRVGRGLVGDALEAIDQLAADRVRRVKAIVGQALRQGHVADAEVLACSGRPPTTNGAYLAPRKFGPPERDMLGIEK